MLEFPYVRCVEQANPVFTLRIGLKKKIVLTFLEPCPSHWLQKRDENQFKFVKDKEPLKTADAKGFIVESKTLYVSPLTR